MKKLILALSILTFTFVSFAAPRFTAETYKAEPSKYLNKDTTLYIHSATPTSIKKKDGYIMYMCLTAYKAELGGYADVLVPEKKSASFLKTYGEVKSKIANSSKSFPSRSYKTKMIEIDDSIYFIGN